MRKRVTPGLLQRYLLFPEGLQGCLCVSRERPQSGLTRSDLLFSAAKQDSLEECIAFRWSAAARAAVRRKSNELSGQIWASSCSSCCREVKRSIGSTHLTEVQEIMPQKICRICASKNLIFHLPSEAHVYIEGRGGGTRD